MRAGGATGVDRYRHVAESKHKSAAVFFRPCGVTGEFDDCAAGNVDGDVIVTVRADNGESGGLWMDEI